MLHSKSVHQVILPLVGVLLSIALILPLPWNEPITDSIVDLQLELRGPRQLSDDILFVFIGPEDVQELGGWPITRDYYAYFLHLMRSQNAAVVGIDVLLGTQDRSYPEHDQILQDILAASNNVVFPFAFSALSASESGLHNGELAMLPDNQFLETIGGIGFSNFSESEPIRKVPLLATHNNSVQPSFGLELARSYLRSASTNLSFENGNVQLHLADNTIQSIPTDDAAQLRLNHFGGLDEVRSIGFVQLLQQLTNSPDSLSLENNMVLLGVTAPGVPIVKSTPLNSLLPATLIHATTAENIVHGNYLRTVHALVSISMIWIVILVVFFSWRQGYIRSAIISSFVLFGAMLLLTQLLFAELNLVIPLLYPLIALISSFSLLSASHFLQREQQFVQQVANLDSEIEVKKAALATAISRLEQSREQLATESAQLETLHATIEEQQRELYRRQKELRDLQAHNQPRTATPPAEMPEIVHDQNGPMAHIISLINRVSSKDISVLIMGETGTGKELVARAIHQNSPRKEAPFVAVNCSALPESLLESELFGHEKGSFTGASNLHKGLFEQSDGGTIFLDEITETTPEMQARLLRVLQEKEIQRIGGEKPIKVDIRIVTATNRDPESAVEDGKFRADLYYRISGFPIVLPPLNERKEDIPLIAQHFLEKHGSERSYDLSESALESLRAYNWPGNIRQLENVIHRAIVLGDSENRGLIRLADLPQEVRQHTAEQPTLKYQSLEAQILESLRHYEFGRSAISETARALGNKDRGTITEYLRGICFRELVETDFNVEDTVRQIAGAESGVAVERVEKKLNQYLENLKAEATSEQNTASAFKGLPKAYHPYLEAVIEWLQSGRSN